MVQQYGDNKELLYDDVLKIILKDNFWELNIFYNVQSIF